MIWYWFIHSKTYSGIEPRREEVDSGLANQTIRSPTTVIQEGSPGPLYAKSSYPRVHGSGVATQGANYAHRAV